MLNINFTNKFKKNILLAKKRGKNLNELEIVIDKLKNQELLPKKYKDHQLTGNMSKYRECHISPDWLLIYYIDKTDIYFTRTGTHSDIF
jgi:mRNA interferase YafQ